MGWRLHLGWLLAALTLCFALTGVGCGSVSGPSKSGTGGSSGTGGDTGAGGSDPGGSSGMGGSTGSGGGSTGSGGASGAAANASGTITVVANGSAGQGSVRLVEQRLDRIPASCGNVQGLQVCVTGGIVP